MIVAGEVEAEVALDERHPGTATVLGDVPPGALLCTALCRVKVDGTLYFPGQQFYLSPERAEQGVALGRVHIADRFSLDWWRAPGRVLSPFDDEEHPFALEPTEGALRIVQGVGYDPGSAAYRFHSALNAASKHTSAFVRYYDTNPHCSLRQYDGIAHAAIVREAILSADVLHCHVNYMLFANAGLVPDRRRQLVVRHYHGSRQDGLSWRELTIDPEHADVLVGARLSHLAEVLEGPGSQQPIEWLPIPVDVARYRRLAGVRALNDRIRVAHSPTRRSYKGTESFLRVVDELRSNGLPIEAVLIEGKSHREALEIKATCDVTFDSFWLGLQGSGLEAGAMGQVVIAGDPSVRALYQLHVGECPYTFAHGEAELAAVLERVVVDRAWAAREAQRTAAYVERYHDYPAVAARYEEILARALGKEDVKTVRPPKPVTPTPPRPATPAKKEPRRPRRPAPEIR